MYEQDRVPWVIAVLLQLAHDAMRLIPCGVMVWEMHTIGIVERRVVGGANHEMIAGHVICPGFGRISPPATATDRDFTF
jgi:hypothetical protein